MDENSNFRKENEGELSAFSTEHLAVGYDKMPLIKDVNLQVRPGEILTLIGPNGSGKSTILKTITRQLKQIGGTVYLGKETMRGMGDNEVSRRLSMVMTERVRTELMSGREVVASGRYPYTGRLGILSPEDWEKVDEAIALVHAKEVQEQDFMKISDGQRQRLMLARAIAQDTKILVLDEPTSYLDMGFKLDILANIRLLARERNLAIVMSLHELDLAQKISDTIACVKGDRIDRIGTPEEIYDEPKTHYVAQFIGRSTILSGRVEAVGKDTAVIRGACGSFTADASRARLSAGEDCEICVRTERMRVSPVPVEGFQLPVTVREARYAGGSVLTYAILPDGEEAVATSEGRLSDALTPGSTAYLYWNPAQAAVIGGTSHGA